MKRIFFLSFLLFGIPNVRADLNVEMGVTLPNSTNMWIGTVDRIKGNQCREDEISMYANTKSHVLNLDTGKGFKLMPDKKLVVKTFFGQSVLTNTIVGEPIKDIGKAETVNGYETEVYTYTNSKANYTLWIAKNYPNFETIKRDLAKRDRLHEATQVGFLYLSTLPGILLKCQLNNIFTNAQFRVVINEKPIDESIFEVPKDYTWQKPSLVANTNEVISATNEPPTAASTHNVPPSK